MMQQVCDKCEGKGRILYEVTYHGEHNQLIVDKCNKCGGSGKVEKKDDAAGI